MASKLQNALLAHCCNSSGYCTYWQEINYTIISLGTLC